jgi:hypothetical protein
MTIPKAELLRITQQVYSKWSNIYDDRDDAEAEEAYANMSASRRLNPTFPSPNMFLPLHL